MGQLMSVPSAVADRSTSSFQRQKHFHHSRIEFNTGAINQLAAGFFLTQRRAKRSHIRERRIRISDAKDPCSQWNLFPAERVRIAHAIPPFMMPTDQQLGGAICSNSRCLAFTDHWMTSKIDSLVFGEG